MIMQLSRRRGLAEVIMTGSPMRRSGEWRKTLRFCPEAQKINATEESKMYTHIKWLATKASAPFPTEYLSQANNSKSIRPQP